MLLPLALVATVALVALLCGTAVQAGAPGPEDEADAEAEAPRSRPISEPTHSAPNVPTPIVPAPGLDAIPVPDDTPAAGAPTPGVLPRRAVLDPAARMLEGDEATESWTLFFDLESGHRVSQRFLLTNGGPGKHNAVAVGHLVEPGRAPYRFVNGRRRPRWTLSDDRLFLDIAASHLDLHRPQGELRITKDDIEIRLFFELPAGGASARVAPERLPGGYRVDVLAVGTPAHGTIQAPWMNGPLETRGRAWLVHTWLDDQEADVLSRRIEFYGHENGTSFYGMQLRGNGDWQSGWAMFAGAGGRIIESAINVPARWIETPAGRGSDSGSRYPKPAGFEVQEGPFSGPITLDAEWLRFDPLEVIPQPFRWFVRMSSRPQEVWADARIGVRLSSASPAPPLPQYGERESARNERVESGARADLDTRSNSKRESAEETAGRSVTGVASITFLNPPDRR